MDDDEVSCIYFLINGEAGYVLPKHQNIMYIEFSQGCHFGIIDIISYFVENDHLDYANWNQYQDGLKRTFTAQCKEQTEMMTLPIDDLLRIQSAFKDCYDSLFFNAFQRLRRSILLKIKAIKFVQKGDNLCRIAHDSEFFSPVCIDDIDKLSDSFFFDN